VQRGQISRPVFLSGHSNNPLVRHGA
jgi:hypothetical protein